MIIGLVSLTCIGVSYVLVKQLIARSHRAGLIDTPNERSSHTVPTPRGGGVGFVVTFLFAALIFQFGFSNEIFAIWLIPSLAAVAVLGFLDDRFSLPASRRLVVQTLAAVVSLTVLFWQLQPNTIYTSETTLSALGAAFAVFSFFWVIWMTNLYNFMDGIDGYAALEAVLVSLVLAGLTFSKNLPVHSTLLLLFAGSVTGFLLLNWSPAKIFMGDAGSTFLGFFFAVMGVALHFAGVPLESVMILLGTFIVDATYTLIVRLTAGKKVYLAHRDHAYQHAVQMGWTHRKTVVVFSSVTLFWLSPLAVIAANSAHWFLRAALLAAAYAPLVLLQVYFKAGIERK